MRSQGLLPMFEKLGVMRLVDDSVARGKVETCTPAWMLAYTVR